MWISVSCYGSTSPPSSSPSPGDICVGLGVQASNETATKLKFNKLLEPNYFSSLALNIFAQYYWHLSFFFSLYYHKINFNSKVNFYTLLFLVSLFLNKRLDFQQNCSITFERVMSTCVLL